MRAMKAAEFKARCLALLDEVAKGHEPIVVTKRGKPVAQVVPLSAAQSGESRHLVGSLLFEDDLVSPIDEAWEADDDRA